MPVFADLFFRGGGLPRLQLGFDSPNKAAVLFGCLALVMTGWGVGNAGEAYMGWYQPLRSHERYRTLVSSHLTWLVELGLWGRMAYCAGWLLMLGWCFRRWRQKDDPLPLAVWLSFGIAATFSSVAESPVLWLVPAAVAIPVIVDFARDFGNGKRLALLAAASVWGALLPLAMMWMGSAESAKRADRVSLLDDVLFFGKGRPQTWIVKDLSVMGGGAYGRALRLYAQEATNATCGIVSELADVPSDVRRLVLCGAAADCGAERLERFDKLKELRVLSPKSPDNWLNATSSVPIRVYCGEFSPRCPSADHPRLSVVNWNGEYLTHWPELAWSKEN